MKWYQSIALKCSAVAFIATHVPLLMLLAVVTLQPHWLTPWGVVLIALAATLAATAVLLVTLWRLFRPLRDAADGLLGFMTRGESLRMTPSSQDEISRLIGTLVHALAHLQRSRTPLLLDSARHSLEQAKRDARLGTHVVLVLVEIDQWVDAEELGVMRTLAELQVILERRVGESIGPQDLALPWGRGRMLIQMSAPISSALQRLEKLREPLRISSGPKPFSVSAVMETSTEHATGRAAALQRLEHRMFSLRAGMGEISVI
jgi:hypothetical protein